VHRSPQGRRGKTTFAKSFLPEEAQCPRFINADLIAVGLRNLADAYKSVVNTWAIYDNVGEAPALLEWGENE